MDKELSLTALLMLASVCAVSAETWHGLPFARSTAPASDFNLVFESLPTWSITHKPSDQEVLKAQQSALPSLVEPGSPFRVVAVYEGKTAIKNTYTLTMPADAHWRVLWKLDVTEKKAPTTFHIELKSKSDPKYRQGIIKEMTARDINASGVINICLTTGGEFTLSLDIDTCAWKVEVQRLN